MASHPEPSLDDHLWTIAVARILLGPAWHVQAPPNLAFEDFPRLLDAGIDDWGGVSPVTIDHVNPEAPWPEIERLARGDARRAGSSWRRGCPLYPEYVATRALARSGRRAVRPPRVRRDWASRARTPGHRASRSRCRSSSGATRCRSSPSATSSARTRSRGCFEARGAERSASSRAADALRREVSGDEVSTS